MMYKWIGAALVVSSCGGFGASLAMAHRREEASLRQLVGVLDLMECELQYRLTPLPELCRQAGEQSGGAVGVVFLKLAEELERQTLPQVSGCMRAALFACGPLPQATHRAMILLGRSLGRFDINGQIKGLDTVREECRRMLAKLSENRENTLRSYQTLGLCAGAALAILFI